MDKEITDTSCRHKTYTTSFKVSHKLVTKLIFEQNKHQWWLIWHFFYVHIRYTYPGWTEHVTCTVKKKAHKVSARNS